MCKFTCSCALYTECNLLLTVLVCFPCLSRIYVCFYLILCCVFLATCLSPAVSALFLWVFNLS